MSNQNWYRDNYTISTDKTRLNTDVIHQFLTSSYWAQGRSIHEVTCTIENSICFGLYDGSEQIGFARIVTDYIFVAIIFDVFILPTYQSRGLGKWLVETIIAETRLKNVRTWTLNTLDAHEFYKKIGFKQNEHPERMMVLKMELNH